MPETDDIIGLILAGGQSRRMFADTAAGDGALPWRDKGLLDLGGRPMLSHVVRRLQPQVARIVINANGDPARFAALGLPVVADTVEGFAGPLAGILAGMLWARRHAPNARYLASASADAPFVPVDLVALLREGGQGKPSGIVLAKSQNELHPVIGLWPIALADDLEQQLARGVRKVLAWTDRHGTTAVDFPLLRVGDTLVDPFFNANTPQELAEARRLVEVMQA